MEIRRQPRKHNDKKRVNFDQGCQDVLKLLRGESRNKHGNSKTYLEIYMIKNG